MKTDPTKRRFLKALSMAPAAAVAAKQTLTSALASHASSRSMSLGMPVGAAMGPSDSPEGEIQRWKNELKWAKERLLEVSDSDHYQYEMLPPTLKASMYADSLRSVSPAIRIQIAERETSRIYKSTEIKWATRAIRKAKKKLGILGFLIE